ncbi:hypothetical protein [Wolbachia endosymbiont of Ctenocephalides felis wCfeT]|uniref:hypothetical protein n=1 Tax=Wolbachia endosymbiont of Ctenocephalides felis wCfeT TaxID=2732593 RepID=UPI0014454D46|nr:hypothetical protein [Wolbachia endosymbiont of Ctenocephalides felis wCfeT]
MKSKRSSSGFKTGAKLGIYAYIASIILGPALLMIAPPLFLLPAALLVMNPVACIGFGIAVTLMSGVGGMIGKAIYEEVVKPLANSFTDFINEKIHKSLINLANSIKNFIGEKIGKPIANLANSVKNFISEKVGKPLSHLITKDF